MPRSDEAKDTTALGFLGTGRKSSWSAAALKPSRPRVEAWLTLEAAETATLPPYLGSTLRGALGHVLRAVLCEGPGCGHECQRPATCRYYSLFESSHDRAKPFLLLAPPPPGLEEIAMGGPTSLPYRTGAPRCAGRIPTLRCEAGWHLDPGGLVRFGLRLVGAMSNALPAILKAVAACGLPLGGSPFRLVMAHDSSGRLLYDRRFPAVPVQMPTPRRMVIEREPAKGVRIVFLSPAVFKLDREPTFQPEDFALRFFEHSIGRATEMCQACTGERPPWVEAPQSRSELVGHRLYHYQLPRHSFRQDKWLDFDGVVGYIEPEGELGASMPWARVAEVLHFGQKSAFGLGEVRVLVLQ